MSAMEDKPVELDANEDPKRENHAFTGFLW
jgi:hypothetical protein